MGISNHLKNIEKSKLLVVKENINLKFNIRNIKIKNLSNYDLLVLILLKLKFIISKLKN